MMAIVAVVALDCLTLRLGRSMETLSLVIVGGLPTQGGLVIGLLALFAPRRGTGKPPHFLVGFEVGGWISHAIFVAICVWAPQWLDSHLNYMLTPLLRIVSYPPIYLLLAFGFVIWYLNAVQLAIALVLGEIFQRSLKRIPASQNPSHE